MSARGTYPPGAKAPKTVAKLEITLKLSDVDLSSYDAIHVAGGRCATFDLFPNEDVAKALEYFWAIRTGDPGFLSSPTGQCVHCRTKARIHIRLVRGIPTADSC